MVSEDNEVSRNLELHALERFFGPVYPDLASAPNEEGILVAIDGSGADPAGYYSFQSGSWSGPWGGASDRVDSALDGTTTVSNTETYGFGQYIEAAENAGDPKRVDIDADTGTLDERYIKAYTDDFELGEPSTPGTDPPTTPEGWAFQPGPGSAAVQGGYYYTDTPDPTTSTLSFGADFVSATAPDGSTISSSTWALEKEYAVGTGGDTLTVQAYGQPTADYVAYNDGATHTDSEAFVGEDDVFVAVEAFDASLQSLALAAPVAYSRPASQQAFDGGRTTALDGTEWVQFSHSATLPAETAFVRVRLQTADGSDTWLSRGDEGSGNAALKLDTYEAGYTGGLRPSAVLQHDHDTQYLAAANGSVAETNLNFDPATQQELDIHTSETAAHHQQYQDSEAVSAVEASSPVAADISGNATSADNVPGSGVNGQVASAAQADGATNLTGGDAEWKTRNGYAVNGGHSDFSSAEDAISFAHNNGYGRVEFPAGTYSRISLGSSTEGLVIAGSGNAKNSAHRTLFEASGNAIQMDGNGMTFENVAVESTNNGDGFFIEGNDSVIRDCCVVGSGREGIRIDAANCHITGTRVFAVPNSRIRLEGVENTIIGNQGVDGYINDRGSGNVYAGLNS